MLQLNQVGRNFSTDISVSNVTAAFFPGTTTALLGANGAGKSTLLKLMAGWLPVATGRISFNGRLIKPARHSARRNMMLIGGVSTYASAGRWIIETIKDYQCDYPEIAADAAAWFERLNLIGCYPKKNAALSKGQNYKLAMIGLFLVRPRVWMFDEPFSCGLDANGLEVLRAQIKAHVATGGTVIFSTQWPEQAVGLANRFVVLHEGNLVYDQPAHHQPKKAFQNEIQDRPALAAVIHNLAQALKQAGNENCPAETNING